MLLFIVFLAAFFFMLIPLTACLFLSPLQYKIPERFCRYEVHLDTGNAMGASLPPLICGRYFFKATAKRIAKSFEKLPGMLAAHPAKVGAFYSVMSGMMPSRGYVEDVFQLRFFMHIRHIVENIKVFTARYVTLTKDGEITDAFYRYNGAFNMANEWGLILHDRWTGKYYASSLNVNN